MHDENLRVFFALLPREPVARALWAMSPPSLASRLPWQSLHVTLAFIGDTDRGQREHLCALADDLSGQPFELTLDQLRYQAKRGLLFATPRATPFALQALERQLWRQLGEQGFRTDKRHFHPHVTLARRAMLDGMPGAPRPVGWAVDEFCLIASHLSGQGPDYEVLQRWRLSRHGQPLYIP